MEIQKFRQETKFVHAGQNPDQATGAVTIPITMYTDFSESNWEGARRSGNPNREMFEKNIAAAENGKFAIAFSSGMAAIDAVLQMQGPNDHMLFSNDLYPGVLWCFEAYTQRKQIMEHSYVDTLNMAEINQAIRPNSKIIWIESPTNPKLSINDIEEISKIAHSHQCLLVIDNTFATPYCQKPLDLGADIVIHSATKYIGGFSDLTIGVVVTNNENVCKQLRIIQNTLGAVPAPFECYNALKGMKTLHLRMKTQSKNALKVAEFLENHEKVDKVAYPGLVSHPHHKLACRQMKYFSGIVTVYLKGGVEEATKFMQNLKIFICAESLGSIESLVKYPSLMSYSQMSAELKAELGISDSLLRLSIGAENILDIIADLSQSLEKL